MVTEERFIFVSLLTDVLAQDAFVIGTKDNVVAVPYNQILYISHQEGAHTVSSDKTTPSFKLTPVSNKTDDPNHSALTFHLTTGLRVTFRFTQRVHYHSLLNDIKKRLGLSSGRYAYLAELI